MIDVIIVIKDGISYEITETTLIKTYKEEKYIPETDKLLDWRLRLMDILEYYKSLNDVFSVWLVTRELLAIDYLLDVKFKHK